MFARFGVWEIVLVFLLPCIFATLCLHITANKTRTPDGWMAWIPYLNLYLFCKIAGQSGLWALALLFVPILDIIVYIWFWIEIAKRRHQPDWYGIMMIVPVVNLVLMGMLAFGNGQRVAARPSP